MTTCPLTYQVMLDGLLVSHLFNKVCNLLHCLLNLGHDAFLSVECLLFLSHLMLADHFNLCIKPRPQIFFILRAEGHLILKLASQILVHLLEHVLAGIS